LCGCVSKRLDRLIEKVSDLQHGVSQGAAERRSAVQRNARKVPAQRQTAPANVTRAMASSIIIPNSDRLDAVGR
jgi:hypothetical protein